MTASLSAFERVEEDIGTAMTTSHPTTVCFGADAIFCAGKGTQEAVLSVAGSQIKASRGN
jgi:hypothetical protein